MNIEKNQGFLLGFIIVIIIAFIGLFSNGDVNIFNHDTINILSSYENSIIEGDLVKYAKDNDIKLNIRYMSDLDIVDELNKNSSSYDGVWISNSMWLYMLDNSYLTSNSKSISISPVVIGIKKSKFDSLNIDKNTVTNRDILNLISNKSLKYVMPSVTQTNAGATAYLGFLNSLAGNPEILTKEIIDNDELKTNLKKLFSGVERVSGDENYLEEMFLNSSEYEAIIASEASLISINNKLKKSGKEELYFVYPVDGVAINDSTLGFIGSDSDKKEKFLSIQSYLLSDEGQKKLADKGFRTWYGGNSSKVSKDVFNPKWGIDTTKYLNVTKFPSKSVISYALNTYIEELRKNTHVVFCLDYSGSMYGSGIRDLRDAMSYILDYNEASKDKLQFSKGDKITVITFSDDVSNVWSSDNGHDTSTLISNINNFEVDGMTALYDAIEKGLDILGNTSDDYTKTIIAMTDGYANVGSFSSLKKKYQSNKSNVPIYSITFGDASEDQLDDIARLSNAKVFNGKNGLLAAFKEVRSYN